MSTSRIAAFVAIATCFSSVSHAGLIVIDDLGPPATSIEIAAHNNFRSLLAGLGIDEYATGLSLGTDVAGTVSYFYYGKEAGYRNDFLASGLSYSTGYSSFQNYFGAPIAIGSSFVEAGLLDFRFCAYSAGNVGRGCVSNVQNDAFSFASLQSIAMLVESNRAWLFWDDSGAGPDDNHDDMLIRVDFLPVEVSEPAPLALLGLSLLGIGFARRRRSKLVSAD